MLLSSLKNVYQLLYLAESKTFKRYTTNYCIEDNCQQSLLHISDLHKQVVRFSLKANIKEFVTILTDETSWAER